MIEAGLLPSGARAPDFTLRGLDGDSHTLGEALEAGPLLLTFFALDCQTCEVSYVHWDRMHVEYAGDEFRLWAIALDPEAEVATFVDKSGVEFPVLLDEDRRVTSAYGLSSTPAQLLIGRDGAILDGYDAFDRLALNRLIATVAEHTGRPAFEVSPAEAPDFRPGCAIHS